VTKVIDSKSKDVLLYLGLD